MCLFYDWLHFSPEKGDSIMNIEPAILLMYNSFHRYPQLTTQLLEYLSSSSWDILPAKHGDTVTNLDTGMKHLLLKSVIR